MLQVLDITGTIEYNYILFYVGKEKNDNLITEICPTACQIAQI